MRFSCVAPATCGTRHFCISLFSHLTNQSIVSLKFKVAGTCKLSIQRMRPSRAVRGHAPPEKFQKLWLEMRSDTFNHFVVLSNKSSRQKRWLPALLENTGPSYLHFVFIYTIGPFHFRSAPPPTPGPIEALGKLTGRWRGVLKDH